MSDIAIQATGLTKIYKVWNKPSDMFVEAVTGRTRHKEFTALENVSFDLVRGSVLGVLGRNGAGKSTLLRLIAGTLDATSGKVKTNGRIASILELGTGFHPDYSGRENVFLGGMCLGLDRSVIKERFDEIVAFAELKDFIDQPFRTYSTGMQARLTFAVATSIDPDILIIDEALAVGDARFSLKSFDRIQAFRRKGKAILLVSHDINTVSSFCDHAILLERGKMIASGEPATVANIYHELLFGPDEAAARRRAPVALAASSADDPDAVAPSAEGAGADLRLVEDDGEDDFIDEGPGPDPNGHALQYGDYAVKIARFQIVDALGRRTTQLRSLGRYKFHLRLKAQQDVKDVGVGILVRTAKGMQVFGANSHTPRPPILRDLKKGETMDVYLPFDANMGHGIYFASVVASRHDGLKHDAQFDVLEFQVQPTDCHGESMANLNMSFEFPVEKSDAASRNRAGGGR